MAELSQTRLRLSGHPDCNPLDFFFLGYVMQHIYRINPTSSEDLKHAVEVFIDPEIISKACATTRQSMENGGRLKHKKSAPKPHLDGDH